MINWRSVEKDGLPTNKEIGYLVSDGTDIEYSDIIFTQKWDSENRKIINDGVLWTGGSVYSSYEESAATYFVFDVKFWCPVNELNLPI